MSYRAWFGCISGCPGQFSLLEVIYRCPTCGDLLEVQHDLAALRARSAAAWIQLFDERYQRNAYLSLPFSPSKVRRTGCGRSSSALAPKGHPAWINVFRGDVRTRSGEAPGTAANVLTARLRTNRPRSPGVLRLS